MTKKEMFTAIMNVKEVAENTEMREFLQYQIDLLDSQRANKKPSKTQVENESIKQLILEVLRDAETPMRVKNMLEDERLEVYSTSKISALLRQMLPSDEKNPNGTGQVVRTTEKKVALYSLTE